MYGIGQDKPALSQSQTTLTFHRLKRQPFLLRSDPDGLCGALVHFMLSSARWDFGFRETDGQTSRRRGKMTWRKGPRLLRQRRAVPRVSLTNTSLTKAICVTMREFRKVRSTILLGTDTDNCYVILIREKISNYDS